MRKQGLDNIEVIGDALREKLVAGQQINLKEFDSLLIAIRKEALRGYCEGDLDWNGRYIATTVYREDMGKGITKLDAERIAIQIGDSSEVEDAIYAEYAKYNTLKESRKRGKKQKK